MGMESYVVKLTGHKVAMEDLFRYVETGLGLKPDEKQLAIIATDRYYTFRDEQHVIEFEFGQRDSLCQVTVRFALCHPPSVDQVFLRLVTAMQTQFNLVITICETLPAGVQRTYLPHDQQLFVTNCLPSIAQCRSWWRQMFGNREIGLSVTDANKVFFPSV